jgi:hypothetical protein
VKEQLTIPYMQCFNLGVRTTHNTFEEERHLPKYIGFWGKEQFTVLWIALFLGKKQFTVLWIVFSWGKNSSQYFGLCHSWGRNSSVHRIVLIWDSKNAHSMLNSAIPKEEKPTSYNA